MFSFFKFLQKTLADLKRKKGLWFTILGITSVSGIFLSLYILTHMTESISNEVYENISKSYSKDYKNRVQKLEQTFKKVLLSVESNKSLINSIANNNLVEVGSDIQIYNESFKKTGFESLNISFYPVINQVNQYRNSINSVINSKAKAFGIEVLLDGIFYVYVEPLIKDDNVIGVLELRQEVQELKSDFLKDDKLFLFLLEERMLNKLSIKARNGKYKDIVSSLYVEEMKYDGKFYASVIEGGKEEYEKMIKTGYSVDEIYFRTALNVSDIDGNIIGTVVLGETVDGTGAFVNIVEKMTKSVTTVALGLIISILLFMF